MIVCEQFIRIKRPNSDERSQAAITSLQTNEQRKKNNKNVRERKNK